MRAQDRALFVLQLLISPNFLSAAVHTSLAPEFRQETEHYGTAMKPGCALRLARRLPCRVSTFGAEPYGDKHSKCNGALRLRSYPQRERSLRRESSRSAAGNHRTGVTATFYRLLLIAMLSRMVFCRFVCVVGSVEMVSVRNVSVMSCLFMRARLVMLGRFKMMACGLLVVLGCLLVVLCTLVSSHLLSSPFAIALCVRRIKFPQSEILT